MLADDERVREGCFESLMSSMSYLPTQPVKPLKPSYLTHFMMSRVQVGMKPHEPFRVSKALRSILQDVP